MNIGGEHILAGLVILITCSFITTCWIQFFYAMFVVTNKLRYFILVLIGKYQNFMRGNNSYEFPKKSKIKIFNLKFIISVFLISATLNMSIWGHQRVSWLSEESVHYKAKEYWVAGQVIYIHRIIFGSILNPENILLLPYTYLQKAVYNQGVKYLPKEDGELYVWKNSWFLYPYYKRHLRPLGVGDTTFEPKMVELLDECWFTMQGLMDSEINDVKMKKRYLLSFPFLTLYYSSYQGHYTGKFLHSGRRTRTSQLYSMRNIKMLDWLDTLYDRWEESDYLKLIWRKYPFVTSCRQYLVLELLQRISLWLPTEGSFSCDHPIMERMQREYQIVMSGDPESNAILNLKQTNKKEAISTYQQVVYTAAGTSGKYLISDICKKIMPPELNLLTNGRGPLNYFIENSGVELVFRDELKPLLKGDVNNVNNR